MTMRRVELAVLMGPLVAGLISLLAGCGGSGAKKGPYVAKNTALLATIRPYPGARSLGDANVGISKPGGFGENGPPYRGYLTLRNYGLDRSVPGKAIVSFYARQLRGRGWHIRGANPAGCDELFRSSSGANLEVFACSRSGVISRYQVHLDHHAP